MSVLKKLYIAYFVVAVIGCGIGLHYITKVVNDANAKIAALSVSEAVSPAPAPPPTLMSKPFVAPAAKPLPDDLGDAIRALEKAPPKPLQAYYYTPKGKVPHGKVYTDANFKPAATQLPPPTDVEGPRLVVEIKAGPAHDLDIKDTVRRLKERDAPCAIFSYVDPKRGPINRIWCSTS